MWRIRVLIYIVYKKSPKIFYVPTARYNKESAIFLTHDVTHIEQSLTPYQIILYFNVKYNRTLSISG